jgi:hypothetical protein
MNRRRFVCALILLWMSLGKFGSARPDERGRSSMTLLAPGSRAHADPKVEPARVRIQLRVVELRGDAQRALKEAGFSGLSRFATANLGELRETGRPGILESLKQHAELDILSSPEITTVLGQAVTIEVSATADRIPYLVRTGEKTFEMREAKPDARLGIRIQLTPQPVADEPGLVRMSPVKISITTLDGREPIPGVDLDIGKPIVSTRTLETSITLLNGDDPSGIVLPAPPGRQPVLLIRMQRVR